MRLAKWYLTREAARDLRSIYARSVKQWGQPTADDYMAEIYSVMNKIASRPDLGKLRAHRAVPFLMVPAGRHFVVYDRLKKDVVILTILHQRRDIEQIIKQLQPSLLAEMIFLKNATKSRPPKGR